MRFHTNLPVRDMQETVRFYTTLFGEKPVKTKADYAKFLPALGGLNISFHEQTEDALAAESALTRLHLGFELESQAELDAAHARLTKAKLVTGARETSVCCYANQDKFSVKDPNGYEWELYVLLEDTEQKIEKTTSCCASADSAPQQSGCC